MPTIPAARGPAGDRSHWRVPAFVGSSDPIATALTLDPPVLVVDVEPLVVPWRSSQAELVQGVRRLRAAVPGATEVVVATNSRRDVPREALPPGVRFVSRARKPWRRAWQPIGPCVVVGDIPVLDGLLARRLGAPLVQVGHPAHGVPWWPRLLELVGRPLEPLFLARRRVPS